MALRDKDALREYQKMKMESEMSSQESFGDRFNAGQRIALSFSGQLGNAMIAFEREKQNAALAREQKMNAVRDQLFQAVTQNYRESAGSDMDKNAYSGAVEKLYGRDSLQFQTLFNQQGTNVPSDELSRFGGGPVQPDSPDAQTFDEPVINPKERKEIIKKGKRVNAQINDGPIIPAIESEEGYLLDPRTLKRMPNAIKAPSRQATGSASDFGLTTKSKGELEKGVFDAGKGMARLEGIQQQFKPEYQQIGTKFKNMFAAGVEKIGFNLSKEDQGELAEFSKFKRNAASNLNRYIKEITGAQMSEAEVKRLKRAVPDAGVGLFDGDSPTEFKSKMDDAFISLKAAQARDIYLRKNGFNGKPWNGKITDEIVMQHPLSDFTLKEAESGLTEDQQKRLDELRAKQGAK